MDLSSLLDIFVQGSDVKRAKLELRWNGSDISGEFVSALERNGYRRSTVSNIDLHPGERVPAFVVVESYAWFGWVFWEKFTERRLRKLFGSVVRNSKGDWQLQITSKMATPLYVNMELKTDMDIDAPASV